MNVPQTGPRPLASPEFNIAVATRSMNERLFQLSGESLGLDRPGPCRGRARHQFTGIDNFEYFRALSRLDADWVINIDEDAFVLQPSRLVELVRYMDANRLAICGTPDGGVVPIRYHNPVGCNAFFNVIDLRRVRPVWHDWKGTSSPRLPVAVRAWRHRRRPGKRWNAGS